MSFSLSNGFIFPARSASIAAGSRSGGETALQCTAAEMDTQASALSLCVIFMRTYRLDSLWENSLSASPALSFSITLSLWSFFILAGSVALRKASESGDD